MALEWLWQGVAVGFGLVASKANTARCNKTKRRLSSEETTKAQYSTQCSLRNAQARQLAWESPCAWSTNQLSAHAQSHSVQLQRSAPPLEGGDNASSTGCRHRRPCCRTRGWAVQALPLRLMPSARLYARRCPHSHCLRLLCGWWLALCLLQCWLKQLDQYNTKWNAHGTTPKTAVANPLVL